VVPGVLVSRLAELTRRANWELRASRATAADMSVALDASAEGRPVLFVPPGARVPLRLAHVLVPHDGTPTTSLVLEKVDFLRTERAEVVALYVAGTELPAQAGSFPALRMVDHDGQDWRDWREEFRRRFFRRSPSILFRLELAAGPRSEAILRSARQIPADLLVLAWNGVLKAGRAQTLRAVCRAAPCPVLLVATPLRGSGREQLKRASPPVTSK
jgi:nucleotide-binding universal stress UspA family protein